MYWCVVPAAGRGVRLGSELPKQYLPLAGKPILLHVLERLASHPKVAGLVVVVAEDDTFWFGLSELFGKPVLTAIGGAKRADSVLSGLEALPPKVGPDDFVLVHDAARPCVRHSDISRLIELGARGDGALLASQLVETIKLASPNQHVEATQPRDRLWRALTPQIFRRAQLDGALCAARASGLSVTDEAMAMERAGFKPLLVEGSADNLKVTTRVDLQFAELILRQI